jgi:hypothetical protein
MGSAIIRKKYWLQYILGLLVLTGTVFYAVKNADSGDSARFVQSVCFLVALIWVAYLGRHMFVNMLHINFRRLTIHPAWLLVLLAIILRCAAYFIMPPAHQTGFEELQTGEIAYRMVWTPELPIEFRFTNLLAFIGFSIGSGINLQALRLPFQIAGIINLVLIVLSLRSLKVGWLPTIMVTFIAATLTFLVIASGTADEIFAGITFASIFLICFIKTETDPENQLFWYAAAGIFAGILMYEYTSYRVLILLGLGWLLWRCFSTAKAYQRNVISNKWFNLLSYIIPLVLVALPTIILIVRNPATNIFLEAFRRHAGERPTILSANFFFDAKQMVLGLTGWPSADSLYIRQLDKPVIQPLVGLLFGLSFIYCLFITNRGLLRAMALSVIALVIGAALLANNPNFSRMAPAIPGLFVMTGVFLESMYSSINQRIPKVLTNKGKSLSFLLQTQIEFPNTPESRLVFVKTPEAKELEVKPFSQIIINFPRIGRLLWNILVIVGFTCLIGYITLSNLDSLIRMRNDPQVINEYVNDDYSICAAIGSVSVPGQQVYIYGADNMGHCSDSPEEGWYFNGNRPIVHYLLVGQFISPKTLVPGDLIVEAARNRSLSNDEISLMTNLANVTNSLNSFHSFKDIAGKINTVSICFQCENLGTKK